MLLSKDELCLFRILRITTFKVITTFRRRQESPAISDWLDLVSKVHTYEIKTKNIHFEKIWAPLKSKYVLYNKIFYFFT